MNETRNGSAGDIGRLYALYPRGYRSGGPEAVHQLVHTARKFGIDAFVFPSPGTEHNRRNEAYGGYDAPEVDAPVDAVGNTIVIPEVWSRQLRLYSRAKKYCWWLSIDKSPAYQAERSLLDSWSKDDALIPAPVNHRLMVSARRGIHHLRGDHRELRSVHHLVQSEYARAFLYIRMNTVAPIVSDWTPLGGLVPDQTDPMTVTYNPAKSPQAIASLRRRMPDVNFLALERMTREEVIANLQRSAAYVDLGYHPGKDRMPREAALCGAVSIVAQRGSAVFFGDVPIPERFKVAVQGDFIGNAARVLRDVLNHREDALRAQELYRSSIRAEQERFESQVQIALAERSPESTGA